MSTHTEHATDPKKEARNYIITLCALLFLTVVTVGASYIKFESSAINIVIALTIATIKASIVSLFFMHLLHDKPVNAIIALAGFLFLGIFLMFDFIDVDTRKDLQPTNLHPPIAALATAGTAPATAGTAPATAGTAPPSAPAAK
jgi:cytochrome c oxidase subunit 4